MQTQETTLELKDLKRCFVQDSLHLIDFIHPHTGRSLTFDESLEQIQERYPGAYATDFAPWVAAKEAALCTEPEKITQEQYDEWLCTLPPKNYQRAPGSESFEFLEHTSGNVTGIFCRIGDHHFTFTGIAGQTHQAIVAKCRPLIG